MPRQARGINRQDIFEDAEDYMRMLRCMQLINL